MPIFHYLFFIYAIAFILLFYTLMTWLLVVEGLHNE